jgi:hypothetical protein
MTARSSGAKKRIVVRHKTQRGSSYTPPKLPDKPKVTQGAKEYGRSKSGGYIITRFYITQIWLKDFTRVKKNDPWFVIDAEEARLASGTKQAGYKEKEKAIRVAKKYRDTYGAWTVMPF